LGYTINNKNNLKGDKNKMERRKMNKGGFWGLLVAMAIFVFSTGIYTISRYIHHIFH